jgi:hypothetical protein
MDPDLFVQKVAYLEAKLVETEPKLKQLEAELAAAQADHERLVAEAEYAVYRDRCCPLEWFRSAGE